MLDPEQLGKFTHPWAVVSFLKSIDPAPRLQLGYAISVLTNSAQKHPCRKGAAQTDRES